MVSDLGTIKLVYMFEQIKHDLHSNGGHNEYEYDQYYSSPPVPAVHERTISEDIPDSVSDRGIILRGPVYDPDSDITYMSITSKIVKHSMNLRKC